ncbi:MAG TPA: EamA family transporter [Blastocatellia bacterium]|nr:EamA family transporter [Blastocatellia bacterium]
MKECEVNTTSARGFSGTDFLLLLMSLIWGSNFTAIKYSLEDLQPLAFNGLRMVIATVMVVIATRMTGKDLRIDPVDRWRMFGLGLLANACYQSLFIIGMAHTRAGNAALIVSTTPLFTALYGRLRGRERFTKRGIFGLLLSFGGLVLIVFAGRDEVSVGDTLIGDTLLIGSTICWSLYTVGSKRIVHVYGSTKSTAVMMLSGTPVLLLLCTPALISQRWSSVRTVAWGGLMFSAIFSIALAYVIWNYGVRKLGATHTAVFGYITPVVAMLVAWPALGEIPTVGQVVGAAIILVGLYLARSGVITLSPQPAKEVVEESSIGMTP